MPRHPIPPAAWPDAARAARSPLFRPTRLGPLEVRRRTWVPAMVPWRSNEDGEVTPAVLDWYGRFADGRPGVLVVEATGIRDVPSGPLLRIGHDRYLDGLRRLTDTVRRRSGGETRLFIQLIDFLSIRRRPEKQKFVRRFLALDDGLRARLADHVADRPEVAAVLVAHLAEGAGPEAPGVPDAVDDPIHAEVGAPVGALDPGALADLLRDGLDEPALREALLALPHEDLLAVLDERRREDLEYGARERVTDTHLPHVADLPAQLPGLFADAAGRALAAGFDGVELHYAHAYTMASFLSATNTRTDGYGGGGDPGSDAGLAGRLRLPLEVLDAVRARIAHAERPFAVGCRMLGDEVIAGGTRVDEAAVIAARLAAGGMDFVSVSKGGKFDDARQPKVGAAAYPYTGPSGHECMPTVRVEGANEDGLEGPFGRNLPLARRIREVIRATGLETPVVGAGGINDFELADRALTGTDDEPPACDLVAAARQSLADPDWWLKAERGEGAAVLRCKYTNYCEALDERHLEVTCQLWDRHFEDPDPGRADVTRSADGKRRLVPPAELGPS